MKPRRDEEFLTLGFSPIAKGSRHVATIPCVHPIIPRGRRRFVPAENPALLLWCPGDNFPSDGEKAATVHDVSVRPEAEHGGGVRPLAPPPTNSSQSPLRR